MNALRGRLLVGGKLLTGKITWRKGSIADLDVEGEIGGEDLPLIVPGLVDLHVHGFGGCEPFEALEGMSVALARAGTTAFQPTLFPAAPQRLGQQCAALWTAAERLSSRGSEGAPVGARVLGLHLEGPFVNPAAAGALPTSDLAQPSTVALREILGPTTGSGRGVRTMTLAPELEGAAELVAELARSEVRVSLGHSRASAAEARSAARGGACGVTHLFNAMSPLHHREAGLVGFALTDGALFAEIIGDLVHVGPEAFELALRARGTEGLCLVSDALQGAGTGCATFHAHGRDHVVQDGAAFHAGTSRDGRPRLAGSVCSQLEMVRRLTIRGVVGLADALTMACTTPARALGLEREIGALRPGLRADLLVLRGGGLEIEQVYVAGKPQI